MQAAVGVVQHSLRPNIPPNAPPLMAEIMQKCWQKAPAARPSFAELVPVLEQLYKQCKDEEVSTAHTQSRNSGTPDVSRGSGGFFSKFRNAAKTTQSAS